MTTKEKLMADMKQAMKDREAGKLRLEVIRMVRSDIRNAEINGKNKEELALIEKTGIANLTPDQLQAMVEKYFFS